MTTKEIEQAVERLSPRELADFRAWFAEFQARQESREITLLSEAALAEDWHRPEEDAAWLYLQSEK
jgi:hypothetical protein